MKLSIRFSYSSGQNFTIEQVWMYQNQLYVLSSLAMPKSGAITFASNVNLSDEVELEIDQKLPITHYLMINPPYPAVHKTLQSDYNEYCATLVRSEAELPSYVLQEGQRIAFRRDSDVKPVQEKDTTDIESLSKKYYLTFFKEIILSNQKLAVLFPKVIPAVKDFDWASGEPIKYLNQQSCEIVKNKPAQFDLVSCFKVVMSAAWVNLLHKACEDKQITLSERTLILKESGIASSLEVRDIIGYMKLYDEMKKSKNHKSCFDNKFMLFGAAVATVGVVAAIGYTLSQ